MHKSSFLCVCGFLVSYLIPFTCLFHIGESHLLPALMSHKRVEDGDVYQCDSESFITVPEQRWRCDVLSGLSLRPTESTGSFGCLSHFLYPTRTPPSITVCKWTPVITCPSLNLIGRHMPYCPPFYSINFLCFSEESITIQYCLYLGFGFFHVLMFIKAIRLFPSGKRF